MEWPSHLQDEFRSSSAQNTRLFIPGRATVVPSSNGPVPYWLEHLGTRKLVDIERDAFPRDLVVRPSLSRLVLGANVL